MTEDALNSTICPRHRDNWGIKWRNNKRNGSSPDQWMQREGPICKQCRTRLGEQQEEEKAFVPEAEIASQEQDACANDLTPFVWINKEAVLEDDELSQSSNQIITKAQEGALNVLVSLDELEEHHEDMYDSGDSQGEEIVLVHVLECSKIPDHCSKYALSDPKERPFSLFACDRAHDQYCLQCEELKDVIQRIERYILECNLGR